MSILIYSKNTCKYCLKVKDFFKEHSIPFTEILFDENDSDYIKQRDYYFNKFKCRTFPMIIIGDNFIGGYNEILSKYNSLELHSICKNYNINIEEDF